MASIRLGEVSDHAREVNRVGVPRVHARRSWVLFESSLRPATHCFE